MAVKFDPKKSALIIQDLQNDVIMPGGAFTGGEGPGPAEHAQSQKVVSNVKSIAAAARSAGMPVIHVWYVVEKGAPGLKVNAPLFEAVANNAVVRGTWGGEDWHTLYIPSSTSLYRVQCKVSGNRLPYMR